MKRLNKLSDEELVNMTESDINECIDLECAHSGIGLLPENPVSPVIDSIDKTEEFYEIGIHYDTKLNKEDMEKLLDFTRNLTSYKKEYVKGYGGPKYMVAHDEPFFTAKISKQHTLDNAQKQYDLDVKQRDAKDLYKTLKGKYDKISEERREITSGVYEAISEASQRISDKERYMNEWERYKDLSNGDEGVAKTFFVDRYSEELYDKVIGE